MSASERRYNTVKALFEMGKIKTYRQLVEQLPYSTVAKDLKITQPRMKRLYANPGKMTLRELCCLSKLLDIDLEKLEVIVFDEVEKCIRNRN